MQDFDEIILSDLAERFLLSMKNLNLTGYRLKKDGVINNEQTLTKIKKGLQDPSKKTIPLYCEKYGVSESWLYTGEGQMMVDDDFDATHVFNSNKYAEAHGDGIINLYDLEAAANLQTLFTNKDQNILGQISIPNIPKCDGAVYVKGDSMYPLLKSGDIVAYKEIPLDVQHIFFGEMYLISIDMDGDEYLTVKYVQHSNKGEDWITLASYNPHHEPKDFPLSSVRAMALIKLSIRMNTMK